MMVVPHDSAPDLAGSHRYYDFLLTGSYGRLRSCCRTGSCHRGIVRARCAVSIHHDPVTCGTERTHYDPAHPGA